MARPLDIKVWDRPESVAFLLKRTGREETVGPEEKAAAGQLAEEQGDLPLALEQAGAYIEACGCSIAQYLDLFRDRRRELLERGQPSQDYPDTMATTWELSFQKVKEASPAAADLLNLCAFLAPDDIPKELLVEVAEHLPKFLAAAVQDRVACNDALAVLRRYSLMEVADKALAVHRLVQAVVRDRLDKKGKEQWARVSVELINAAFPSGIPTDVDAWPWCGRLLPHALTATGLAHDLGLTMKAAGHLLNQVGLYLGVRAEFAAARKAHERAIVIAEAAYGLDHPQVAIRVNNLGRVLHDLGDLEGAKAHLERALAIDEASYGPDHPDVATDINNLGGVLYDLGDLAGGRAHYERALAIDEAAYGPDHPEVATDVNNLGAVLRGLGDLPGSKAHHERALAIDEASYGPDHPVVATDVYNLGSVLEALGDLAGARAHYERALAIWLQFLGEDHPQTKIVRKNLATLGLPLDE